MTQRPWTGHCSSAISAVLADQTAPVLFWNADPCYHDQREHCFLQSAVLAKPVREQLSGGAPLADTGSRCFLHQALVETIELHFKKTSKSNKMPLSPSYGWEQTEDSLTVRVGVRGFARGNNDMLSTGETSHRTVDWEKHINFVRHCFT